jgi:hypothetical protein
MSHDEEWQPQESLDEDPAWLAPLLQERRLELERGGVELLTLEQVKERHRARNE